MESKPKLNLQSINVGFIITGMMGLIEEEGFTTREVFLLLDEIKQQTWSALNQIEKEK